MVIFSFSFILRALAPERGRLFLAVASEVLAAVAAIVPIIGIIEFVREPSAWPVWLAAGGLLIAAVLHSIAAYLAHLAEARFETTLRLALAETVSNVPVPTLSRLSQTGLRARLDGDVTALHHLVAHAPGEIATMFVAPVVAMSVMVAYAGPAALLVAIPAVASLLVSTVVIPRLAKAAEDERQRTVGEIIAAVDDFTRGIVVTKIYGNLAGASARYSASTERFATDFRRWVRRVSTPAAIAAGILQPAVTLATAFAVGQSRPLPVLAALMLLSVALTLPVLRLGHGLDYVRAGIAAAHRIEKLQSEPTLRTGPSDVTSLTSALNLNRADLRLRDVVVDLDGRRVLNGVTLEIPANTFTAITGRSGSGKTTLLRVLGRGIDPNSGDVAIGGRDYGTVPLSRMSELVVTVPQNPGALPRSVRANLLLAASDAVDAQLREALHTAVLEVALDADAESLSGGQRQRLAIARALLTDAPVILLDEPTSALDHATAAALMRSLAGVQERTIVMVTHNAEHAANAPHHIELQDGKVLA